MDLSIEYLILFVFKLFLFYLIFFLFGLAIRKIFKDVFKDI